MASSAPKTRRDTLREHLQQELEETTGVEASASLTAPFTEECDKAGMDGDVKPDGIDVKLGDDGEVDAEARFGPGGGAAPVRYIYIYK